jgi:hypothetical protein
VHDSAELLAQGVNVSAEALGTETAASRPITDRNDAASVEIGVRLGIAGHVSGKRGREAAVQRRKYVPR